MWAEEEGTGWTASALVLTGRDTSAPARWWWGRTVHSWDSSSLCPLATVPDSERLASPREKPGGGSQDHPLAPLCPRGR